MKKGSNSSSSKMTHAAASRIQSATAKGTNGQVAGNSFAARAQSAAAKGSGKK